MTRYAFTVPGPPVPKGRPRLGAHGYIHTPARTKAAELAIWAHACRARVRPITGSVALEVVFYLPDRKRRDLDNLVKTVMDALNGRAWGDDSQITELHARILWSTDQPRTEITIEGADPCPET